MILHYSSGLKEDSMNVCVNEIFDFSLRIAKRYVNGKRVRILRIISVQKEPRTITRTVDEISKVLCCPKSTVWMNVNILKELGLIENGRGRPVSVTKVGKMILGNVTDGGMNENKRKGS